MSTTLAQEKRIMYFRNRKATALVDLLVSLDVRSSEARTFTAEDWAQAAVSAKINPPSATTVALVLSQLEGAYDADF